MASLLTRVTTGLGLIVSISAIATPTTNINEPLSYDNKTTDITLLKVTPYPNKGYWIKSPYFIYIQHIDEVKTQQLINASCGWMNEDIRQDVLFDYEVKGIRYRPNGCKGYRFSTFKD